MNEVAYGNVLTEVILDSDEWLDGILASESMRQSRLTFEARVSIGHP